MTSDGNTNSLLLMLAMLLLSIAAMSLAGWWIGSKTQRLSLICVTAIGFSLALCWTWNPFFSPKGVLPAWFAVPLYVWSRIFSGPALALLALSIAAPVATFVLAAWIRTTRLSARSAR